MPRKRKKGLSKDVFSKEAIDRKVAPQPIANEAMQFFNVTRKFGSKDVIGTNLKIQLDSGLVAEVEKARKNIDRITSAKRKSKKPRRTIEVDVWGYKNGTHYLMELKNLPKKENPSTVSRYYRQAVEESKLLTKNPFLLGNAYPRNLPLDSVGNFFYRTKTEKWQEGKRIGYFLVVNRPLTEKEWGVIEKIRKKVDHHVTILMHVEIPKLIEYVDSKKHVGRFAGKNQFVYIHPHSTKGPIDKFLEEKGKEKKGETMLDDFFSSLLEK